ncbi:MAG: ABC transporter substrate-binding protein [Anaerolineae bacterium]|nr:ABC transporter substrate-binding protein [Anaerolineae bacterium]
MNIRQSANLKKFATLSVLVIALLTVFGVAAQDATEAATPSGDPIVIGVSGPLTGDLAQYGEQWKKGFDLALEEINGSGGVIGRPLTYDFEDSQSDPKQSVIVAQKFVDDDKIVVELGDFSSTASMAASQIYTRGGLVQFGFTNSHPDFTKASDYTWSTSVTQDQATPALADFAVTTLGLKKIAIFQIQNDYGKATIDILNKRIAEIGGTVVATQAYLPDEKDFKSAITAVKDAQPDGIILVSYVPDAALIAQQVRDAGLTVPFVSGASIQSPDFPKLGGAAVEGTYILGEFLPSDPRPEVQKFVASYKAKYNEDPDLFASIAYDSIYLVKAAIELGGPTRQGIHDALPQLKDVPSVVYKLITFDPVTRRAQSPTFEDLIVKGGDFVPLAAAQAEATTEATAEATP